MGQKFVGRDVQVFSIGGVSMIGRWESITVKITKTWSEVTSSDADTPEKRRLLNIYSATCKTWIDTAGSISLAEALIADTVIIFFTEVNSGKTMQLVGGIMNSEAAFGAENGKDSMDVESVGLYGGAQPLTYL